MKISGLEEFRKKLQQSQQVNQTESLAKLDPTEKSGFKTTKRSVRLKSDADITLRNLKKCTYGYPMGEIRIYNLNFNSEEPESSS